MLQSIVKIREKLKGFICTETITAYNMKIKYLFMYLFIMIFFEPFIIDVRGFIINPPLLYCWTNCTFRRIFISSDPLLIH